MLSASEQAMVLWNKLIGRRPVNSGIQDIILKYKGIERERSCKQKSNANNE